MALADHLNVVQNVAKTVTSLIVSVSALFGTGFVFKSVFHPTAVVLDQIDIPESLETLGFKSEVVVQRLLDEINTYKSIANSNPKGGVDGPELALFSGMSRGADAKIEANVGGFSLQSIEQAVRYVFQKDPPIISGDITKVSSEKGVESLEGRVRLSQQVISRRKNSTEKNEVDDLIKLLAFDVYAHFEPLRAALAAQRLGQPELALEVLRPLVISGTPKERKFALWLRSTLAPAAERDQYLLEALFIDPDFYPALIGMAEFEVAQKRYAESIEYADRAILLDPSSPLGYNAKGVALRSSGDRAAGVKQFEKACALPVQSPGCHIHLGLEYMRAVDRQPPTKEALRKAYTEFSAAIKANPRAAWAHSNAAYVSTELNDLKEAKILILRAIELEPAEPRHQFRHAWTRYRMGERAKAKEMMTNLLEAHPNWLTTRGPQGAQRIANTVLGGQ
jgi:tetratricopeptide (TPR) repeat protein